MIFHKSYILGYKKFVSGMMIAFITLLNRRVAKKDTSKGPRINFILVCQALRLWAGQLREFRLNSKKELNVGKQIE